MKRTKIMWATVAAIAIISSFVAGMAAGTGLGPDNDNEFLSGYKEAMNRLAQSGIIPPTTDKVTAVSGKVVATLDSAVSIEIERVTMNPLEDQGPTTRLVTIGSDAKIIKLVPRSAAEMDAATKSFQESLRAGQAPLPPLPFKEEGALLSDIKEGMAITVISESDIRTAANIEAVKVTFQ